MVGTVFAQTRRKEMKGGGQFSYESSIGVDDDDDLLDRGRGTEGGFVVHRNAAKYKHNAGPSSKKRSKFENGVFEIIRMLLHHYVPVIIRSPSALLRMSTSRRCSVFA